MKLKLSKSFLFFSFIGLLSSCLVDIPVEKVNDPTVYIPPVLNDIVSDSISNLIKFETNSVIDTRNTKAINTYSVASSSYFLGFTDLIKYNNKWYLSYRMSDGHVGYVFGHSLIMESEDFSTWKLSQVFTQKDYDLRDPKLFVADTTLYTNIHSTSIQPYYGEIRNDYISKYNHLNGSWESAKKIDKGTNEKSWFWRIAYDNNLFYSISYINGIKLYTSTNGTSFRETYRFNEIPSSASEAAIGFKSDTIYSLLRGNTTFLYKSPTDSLSLWTKINEFPISIGGPNFQFYKNKLIISGRDHKKGSMILFTYDLETGQSSKIINLPSNDETGYSGMFIEGDKLYISYYNYILASKLYHIYVSIIDLNQI